MFFLIWVTKRHQLTCVLHDDVILVMLMLANLLLFVLLFLFVYKLRSWLVARRRAGVHMVRIAAPLAVVVVFLFAFCELTSFADKICVASFIVSFHLFV